MNAIKEKIINAYWWCIRTWKYKICYIHREVYWFFQRGFRGYSDYDVWDFDHYLAGVIGKGLKHLAKDGIGYPCKDEFPTLESWHKVLNELSAEFLKYHREYESEADDLDEYYKWYLEKFKKEILPKFIEHIGNYWD